MSQPVPSIGRMVHFVHGDLHVPAIIVEPAYHLIEPGPDEAPIQDALTVFTRNHGTFSTLATFDPEAKSGTWHWPEYVPAKE